jgi:aryl-alcohol dehydrogenase-like predicted oxidoreductase
MHFRRFGNTGFDASYLTLGGCGLGWLHEKYPKRYQQVADSAIQNAIDAGVNLIDVAPSYGDAELRLQPWMPKIRSKIFLSEKTMERTKIGAETELQKSLDRLGVKSFDLYQFHAVSTFEELNQIMEKNGAVETFVEAKECGLIKNIGITGHNDVRILLKALDLFDDFSTVLFPVYAAAMINPTPQNEYSTLLKKVQEQNLGLIAIKAISFSRWNEPEKYGTWYRPLEDELLIQRAINFTLSQTGVTTYSMACDVTFWPLILKGHEKYGSMSEEAQGQLIEELTKLGANPLFPE